MTVVVKDYGNSQAILPEILQIMQLTSSNGELWIECFRPEWISCQNILSLIEIH